MTPTYGGYSKRVVVSERFVLRIPAGLDLAAAAPLLCAGITTYSPLRQWNCKPGDRVGVVGLGGRLISGVMLRRFFRGMVAMPAAVMGRRVGRTGSSCRCLGSMPVTTTTKL